MEDTTEWRTAVERGGAKAMSEELFLLSFKSFEVTFSLSDMKTNTL